MKKLNQSGSHLLAMAVAIVVFCAVGFVGWRVAGSDKKDDVKSVNDGSSQKADSAKADDNTLVTWSWSGSKWSASGTPTACKDPVKFANTPSDLSNAAGVLYPGQTRGGNYKPHGGFRFSLSSNNLEVKAVMDGYVASGSRYIEGGEVQYLFTVVNSCGIAYRFDHLLTLSPAFEKLANSLPEAKVDDSRTTNFDKPLQVKAGDVVATAIGFKKTTNYSYDFGVYDYRKQNAAASDAGYVAKHQNWLSQATYALCWLDMFSATDSAKIKNLPAVDMTAGKTSDYCK